MKLGKALATGFAEERPQAPVAEAVETEELAAPEEVPVAR